MTDWAQSGAARRSSSGGVQQCCGDGVGLLGGAVDTEGLDRGVDAFDDDYELVGERVWVCDREVSGQFGGELA